MEVKRIQNNNVRPITDRQKDFLQRKGYQGNIDDLTMDEASAIINDYIAVEAKKAVGENPEPSEVFGNQAPQPKPQPKQEVAKTTPNAIAEKNISDKVINQINVLTEEQGLVLPKDYNVTNALKAAYLTLAEQNLLNTDQTALAQALLSMCIQGLNPAKKQCWFINYAGKVNLMRSYFGDKTVAINTGLVKDVDANIIYEGDEVNVTYVDDLMHIEHKTSWLNFDKPIVGAYAWAIMPDGTKKYDIMQIDRIKKSWAMSKNKTNNQLQSQFTDDACKRTVIRHLVKYIFNSTNDRNLVVDAYNRSTDNEYDYSKEYENDNIDSIHKKQADSGYIDPNYTIEDDNLE